VCRLSNLFPKVLVSSTRGSGVAQFQWRCASQASPGAQRSSDPRKAALSLDQALYLAKEAGFFTTREVQLQIVRSPPFSRKERPFLIENFFELADIDSDESRLKANNASDEHGDSLKDLEMEDGEELHQSNATIHGAVLKHFRSDRPNTFLHNGEEWLERAEGRGTRKRSAAHVVICRGTGIFKVNGEMDMFCRWPHIFNRFDVCQPFKLTGTAGAYDVFVETRGGGGSGQAGATRLAVARALLMANSACHDRLQSGFCLLEDTRQKMSKMPGKASARASFAWTKR